MCVPLTLVRMCRQMPLAGVCQSESWLGCETGEALALGAKLKEVPIASETNVFCKRFIFVFWLWWVFTAVLRLSLAKARRGVYSSLGCLGFSLWWLLLLRSTGGLQ